MDAQTPSETGPVAEPDAAQDGADPGAPSVYQGEVVPVDSVEVIAQASGLVRALLVHVGDEVAAGAVLARIDSATLETRRAQALADLQAAQAQLELLRLPAAEADIEAARAAVTAADAAYKSALAEPTPADLAAAEVAVRQAEAALQRAQAAYDQVAWNPLVETLPEGEQLAQSRAALAEAQARLDRLAQGADANAIATAYARLAEARAHLRRLEDGPAPAQLDAAEAQVHQAETALYLAQLDLDKATVTAPIAGIVAQLYTGVGAMALPNAPVARIISPDVQIVVAVEETHLPLLAIGQPAEIEISAYPGKTIPGEIVSIAAQVDPTTRRADVTLRPVAADDRLLPGMSAKVTLVALASVDDTMQGLSEPPAARSP